MRSTQLKGIISLADCRGMMLSRVLLSYLSVWQFNHNVYAFLRFVSSTGCATAKDAVYM